MFRASVHRVVCAANEYQDPSLTALKIIFDLRKSLLLRLFDQ